MADSTTEAPTTSEAATTTDAATTQAPDTTAAPVATAAPTAAPTEAPTAQPTQPENDDTNVAPPTNPSTTTTTTAAPTNSDLPTGPCLARLQEAMGEGTPADYVEAYYPALSECTGLADWLAAVDETGFDAGEDPTAWAAQVCGLDGPMIRPTCVEAMAAAQANN